MGILSKILSPFRHEELIEEPIYIPKKPRKKFAVLGDFHIPGRAKKIPDEFVKVLKSEKFEKILCTGDLTNEATYTQLTTLGAIECITGNMDAANKYPVEKRLSYGKYKIGITHARGVYPRGDAEQLLNIAESMDVNILITGHTHTLDVRKYHNKLFLNPGSATGVYSGGEASLTPSMLIFELNEKIHVRLLKIVNNQLHETTQEFELELPSL